MIKNMLMELENSLNDINFQSNFQSNCLLLGVQSKIYQPLMKREMCGKYTIKACEHKFVDKAEIYFQIFSIYYAKISLYLLFIHSVRLLIY